MKSRIMLTGCAIAAVALAGCDADAPAESEFASAASETTGIARQALQGPEGFYIKDITGNGSGCRDGVVSAVTPDRQTFTVYFSDMELAHPPGPTYQRINCAVGATLHVPRGWQLSIGTINTRGYAHLPVGTSGKQTSTYFFAGRRLSVDGHSTINGYHDKPYVFTDTIGIASVITSACGEDAILNINTSLDLNTAGNPTSDAYFNNETIDGTFRKVFQLGWDQCVG